ncbi:hypothetical protein T4B_12517, partial [Trichinella pseudospiralis]
IVYWTRGKRPAHRSSLGGARIVTTVFNWSYTILTEVSTTSQHHTWYPCGLTNTVALKEMCDVSCL